MSRLLALVGAGGLLIVAYLLMLGGRALPLPRAVGGLMTVWLSIAAGALAALGALGLLTYAAMGR